MLSWEPPALSCRYISRLHPYSISPTRFTTGCGSCPRPGAYLHASLDALHFRSYRTTSAGICSEHGHRCPWVFSSGCAKSHCSEACCQQGVTVYVQAMAASVLLRGLLFASVHQAPRRWLPLRKSAWGVAQQGIAANLAQLRRLIWAKTGSSYVPAILPWQTITYPATGHGGCCCLILLYFMCSLYFV